MDLNRPSDRLALCGMAMFHTVVLVTILITGLHFNDSLGHALGSLSPATGLGLFCLLWITTWWSTRKYVRRLGDFLDLAVKTPVNEIVHKAGSGGAINGLLFSVVLAVIVAIAMGQVLVIGLFFWGFLLALMIGLLIGIIFGVLEWDLFRAARWLAVASTSELELPK